MIGAGDFSRIIDNQPSDETGAGHSGCHLQPEQHGPLTDWNATHRTAGDEKPKARASSQSREPEGARVLVVDVRGDSPPRIV